jgi:hypothetical protein
MVELYRHSPISLHGAVRKLIMHNDNLRRFILRNKINIFWPYLVTSDHMETSAHFGLTTLKTAKAYGKNVFRIRSTYLIFLSFETIFEPISV